MAGGFSIKIENMKNLKILFLKNLEILMKI
jgi:hypothetical protein